LQRKNAILQSASDHFGRYGFRGASLRDIARDAGVSLTLLNHHFGGKAALLSAVLSTHQAMLEERVRLVRRVCSGGPGSFTALELVRAWTRLAFETAATPDGQRFLRLLARVIDDPAEDDVVVLRERLDEARLAFVDALQQCYPNATRRAATMAALCVGASLLKVLVAGERVWAVAGAERPGPGDADERLLERFLVGALDTALGSKPEPDAPHDHDATDFAHAGAPG